MQVLKINDVLTAEKRLGVKFPVPGEAILAHVHDGKNIAGYAGSVWTGGNQVWLEIMTIHGKFQLFPERGDSWVLEVTDEKAADSGPGMGQ